jgi:hydrogenase nickel incorporation protein HypA/HybF
MHEFALAQDIIETISRTVDGEMHKLQSIQLEVGDFAGVVIDSLEFGLEVILKDKNLSEVKINISKVPATARCECETEYPIQDMLQTCPSCQSFNRKIITGTEVLIKSVDLMD